MFNYNNNQYGQNQIPRYNTQLAYGQVPQQTIQQSIQPIPAYTPQPVQPINTVIQGLQGKIVDSIDVVKAMDIPLDGSISYFPITDGTAIVTKQLQSDGSSKTIVYKPIEGVEETNQTIYITSEELENKMKDFSVKEVKDIKDELKLIKREIRDIKDDIKEK